MNKMAFCIMHQAYKLRFLCILKALCLRNKYSCLESYIGTKDFIHHNYVEIDNFVRGIIRLYLRKHIHFSMFSFGFM